MPRAFKDILGELGAVLVIGVALTVAIAVARGLPKRQTQAAFCESPVAQEPSVAWIKALEAAKHLHDSKFVFVDTRAASLFAQGHIAGALDLSAERLHEPATIEKLKKAEQIIVYGETAGNCESSRRTAQALSAQVGTKMHVLEGGFEAWLSQGLPAESGAR